MKLVAITGSIGCGKTTISNMLREQGILVYDIDKWVKFLYYKRDFLKTIQRKFPQVFDGEVFNKRKLRNIVFSDANQRKELENLIHPYLEKKLRRIIRTNKNEGIVFCDVALLFEMKWDKYFDYIILADVDKAIQKARVMTRDKISAEDFYKIDSIQLDMAVKREKVDFIIDTGVTFDKLRGRVIKILEELEDAER